MRFSIIIPLYQQEGYMRACVESVLSQSFSDFQVILVDDGSTDATPQICDEYAASDSRVIAVHKENGGLSDARNSGAEHAKGEYLIFLDGDDMLAEDALLNVDALISANDSPDAVVCRLCQFTDEKTVTRDIDDTSILPDYFSGDLLVELITQKGFFINPSVCRFSVKRSFYSKAGLAFKKGLLHEDELFSPLLICAAETFCTNRSMFYLYRSHTGTITTAPSLKNKTDILKVAALLLEERTKYEGDHSRTCLLTQRAKWLFRRGLLESITIKGANAGKVAEAAAEAYRLEHSIADELPKLKILIRLLGPRIGTASFIRLVKLKRRIVGTSSNNI